MNPLTSEFTEAMVLELRSYLSLCEEIFNLTVRESQALADPAAYQQQEFNDKRSELLPRMAEIMAQLRHRRIFWQQVSPSDRERCEQVKPLFQNIQNLLMKILMLDRENQQAMLRRGLVPVRHLPSAPARPANFVASVYQRNCAAAI